MVSLALPCTAPAALTTTGADGTSSVAHDGKIARAPRISPTVPMLVSLDGRGDWCIFARPPLMPMQWIGCRNLNNSPIDCHVRSNADAGSRIKGRAIGNRFAEIELYERYLRRPTPIHAGIS